MSYEDHSVIDLDSDEYNKASITNNNNNILNTQNTHQQQFHQQTNNRHNMNKINFNSNPDSTGTDTDNGTAPPTTPNIEDIYSYYKEQLIPAITSSLPLLFSKIRTDIQHFIYNALTFIVHVLVPWTRDDFEWHEVPDWFQSKQENITMFLLRNLDINHDGELCVCLCFFLICV